jgi:hypothetical protein
MCRAGKVDLFVGGTPPKSLHAVSQPSPNNHNDS